MIRSHACSDQRVGRHLSTFAESQLQKPFWARELVCERGGRAHLEHDPVLLLGFLNHTHVAAHRDRLQCVQIHSWCRCSLLPPRLRQGLCLWQWGSPTLLHSSECGRSPSEELSPSALPQLTVTVCCESSCSVPGSFCDALSELETPNSSRCSPD